MVAVWEISKSTANFLLKITCFSISKYSIVNLLVLNLALEILVKLN